MERSDSFALHSVRRPDRLRELGIVALNGMFDERDALGVLRQAATDLLHGDMAVVSSFGADSVVLLHLVAEVDADIPVLFLETGKHFAETLEYVETLRSRLGLTDVRTLRPDPADLARFDPEGTLWESDPDSCCHIRKTEPLDEALEAFSGWVTGRKRFQTAERGVLPHFELTSDDRIKVNPLAYWTEEDIARYKVAHDLPEHPLFEAGYRSVGCAPCTSAVAAGENARAGRWRGFDKSECGIHFDVNGRIANPMREADHRLFRDDRFMADPFRPFAEGDDPEHVRYTHVPVSVFVENRDAVLRNPHPLGLLIEPGDRVEGVAGDLHRFASVAIAFPSFTDGRGYTSARLVVERFGYEGEVRAVGDVLADQIPFMRRCGITAFVVTNDATRKALVEGKIPAVSVHMQPVGAVKEVPVGTRPFLRRAASA